MRLSREKELVMAKEQGMVRGAIVEENNPVTKDAIM